jgi:hypothetical protein
VLDELTRRAAPGFAKEPVDSRSELVPMKGDEAEIVVEVLAVSEFAELLRADDEDEWLERIVTGA